MGSGGESDRHVFSTSQPQRQSHKYKVIFKLLSSAPRTKLLFAVGLINLKKLFFKIFRVEAFWIPGSRFLHSMMTDGEKSILYGFLYSVLTCFLYHLLCRRCSMYSSCNSWRWIILNSFYFLLKRCIIRVIINNISVIKMWSNEWIVNRQ